MTTQHSTGHRRDLGNRIALFTVRLAPLAAASWLARRHRPRVARATYVRR